MERQPAVRRLKSGSAPGFLSPPRIWGLSIDRRAAASLFPHAAPRCRVKKAKAWFCLFRILFSEIFRRAKNRAPENRSEARFLGRGGAALQVEHFAIWQNADRITKSKQRGLDRKRVSHHICGVKALGNMSLYYLRALPCICGNLPACDCYAP